MTTPASASGMALTVSPSDLALAKSIYDRRGIVVVRGLLDAEVVGRALETLRKLLAARAAAVGIDGLASASAHELINALQARDRRYVMDVIRIGKDLPEFYGTFTHPGLLEFAKALVGSDILQCVHDIAQIRIDPPDDAVRNFDWHQDFQYNLTSENAVTAWFPLSPIDRDMGRLVVAPESHRALAKVELDRRAHVPGQGTTHATVKFQVDQPALEARAIELDIVEPGDVAFFDCKLLHRSGLNRSDRSRIVFNPRYGNALDPAVVGRGWSCMRDKTQDLLEVLYPDLLVSPLSKP